ncbi:hypothetical protein [Bacillus proteolyticus]|uniref:hypothetical protein n=1 Tax=Bacillus proteolyticus TaxID=2026192 RepID=UPI0030F3D751
MKLETGIINELCSIKLLSHSEDLSMDDFKLISSLDLADKHLNGLKWENICLEEISNVSAYLSKNQKRLFEENWNCLVLEIKREIIPILDNKISKLIDEGILLESMRSQILFDIMNISLCKCYSLFYKSAFLIVCLKFIIVDIFLVVGVGNIQKENWKLFKE